MAQALRTVYRAADAEAGQAALDAFAQGPWGAKYPAIAQSWRRNWELVIPFFAFPEGVRRIIYTTNAIEALNSKLRRAVRTRGHFPSDDAASEAAISGLEPRRRGLETAAARVGRGEDAIRRHVQRALRARMTDNRLTHRNSDSPDSQEVADLQRELQERDNKLAEAQKAQTELIRKQQELVDAKREMDLQIETRVQNWLRTKPSRKRSKYRRKRSRLLPCSAR